MRHLTVIVVAICAIAAPLPVAADEVDDAYALCRVADATGLESEPCEVSGWGSAVVFHIDMASDEARGLCANMQGFVRDNGLSFGGKWKLEIKSPYSNGQPIAYCVLP